MSPFRSILCSVTATPRTHLYALSLHDALPIYLPRRDPCPGARLPRGEPGGGAAGHRLPAALGAGGGERAGLGRGDPRSEEHTSKLQSRGHLVCRLLLEKKKASIDIARALQCTR